jgi:cell wall-associated NlpC family hydrolase
MLGIEYQYGANGPYRYDCSSFTKYVFSRQGIKIPRVSRDQAKVGQFIYRSQLQKGDLIFFDSKRSSRVSHVGIYLDHGQFIHASSAKKRVTISSLNSKYYREHFKWGRRVINSSYTNRWL